MKKYSIALALCLALIQPVFASGTADVPGVVQVSLELTKDSKQIWKGDVSTADGRRSKIYTQKERAYAHDCKPNGKGAFVATNGSLTTGVVAEVTPTILSTGEVLVDLSVQYRELEGMKIFPRENGCSVEAPEIRSFSNVGQLKLRPGQAAEIPAVGDSKFNLIVRIP